MLDSKFLFVTKILYVIVKMSEMLSKWLKRYLKFWYILKIQQKLSFN